MRTGIRAACVVLVLAASACAPTTNTAPSARANAEMASNADFADRMREMRSRFPPSAPGTPEQRATVARELFERHMEHRRSLSLTDYQFLAIGLREALTDDLANAPVVEARRQERELRASVSREAIARFDGRQVAASDVSRLASDRANAMQSELPSDQRRAALAIAEGDIRRELEDRRRSFAASSAQRREADLTRLALSGLADMPREITLAAAENLADARSPFDTRPNWRPDPAALRQEEVRLRNAVASRMEAERRQADSNARASANAAASHQQADLQRAIEMARADAERERRERQNLRLIELGLGMAAGANRPPSPSNDGIRTYNVNGRMFTCTTSGTFTNCF